MALTIFAYKGASFDQPATSWPEADRRAKEQEPEMYEAYEQELIARSKACWEAMKTSSFLWNFITKPCVQQELGTGTGDSGLSSAGSEAP